MDGTFGEEIFCLPAYNMLYVLLACNSRSSFCVETFFNATVSNSWSLRIYSEFHPSLFGGLVIYMWLLIYEDFSVIYLLVILVFINTLL